MDNVKELETRLGKVETYEDWLHVSKLLDEAENLGEWREDPKDDHYEFEEVSALLDEMREARVNYNIKKLLYLVRTKFTRNFANTGDQRLYTHARSGTKCLIEEFISECELVLETIVNDIDSNGSESPRSFSRRDKLLEYLEVLSETRKAYGRTALVFSGGSIMGFMHAGITRELINANLMPKIVSGSSAGSIFASVFCTRKDEEFESAWELLNEPMNIFEKTGEEESLLTHLKRFCTVGTWIDSAYLKEMMQHLIGDITFREAFNRTGRILNVNVSVAGSHDMPRLLNYLTAPNVVIWSAVVCSCSVPLLFTADSIWAKDPKTKNIYPWSNGNFIDGSVDNDMPLNRLTEMFNINHFVACQVNPHIAPLFNDDQPAKGNWVAQKIANGWRLGQKLVFRELEHGLTMMRESGVGSSAASVALNVINQEYWGDISIVPQIMWGDLKHLFKNPTSDVIADLVKRGRQVTWPKIALIRNHCAVELALDRAIFDLNSKLVSEVADSGYSAHSGHSEYQLKSNELDGYPIGYPSYLTPEHHQDYPEHRHLSQPGEFPVSRTPTQRSELMSRSRSVASISPVHRKRKRKSVTNLP